MLSEISNLINKSKNFKEALRCKSVKDIYGGLKSFFIHSVSKNEPYVCVFTRDEYLSEDIKCWSDKKVLQLPKYDDDEKKSSEIKSQIISSVAEIKYTKNWILFTDLDTEVPYSINIIHLSQGMVIEMDELTNKLIDFGFNRVGTCEEIGEFAIRGSIIDFWAYNKEYPIRCEFLGNEIISLREFDPLLQTSINKIEKTEILPINLDTKMVEIISILPKDTFIIFDGINTQKICPNIIIGEGYSLGALPSYKGNIKIFEQTLNKLQDYKIFISCKNVNEKIRIQELFPEIEVLISNLTQGFIFPDAKLSLFTYEDIFGKKIKLKKIHPFKNKGLPIEDINLLNKGDYIVHIDYGIGIYNGLEKLKVDSREVECLVILYKNNDKLYVSVDNFKYIERWIGSSDNPPELTQLGSPTWELKKSRAKKAIQNLTKELVRLYAERKISKGTKFSKDTIWQAELESSFPYEETEDQLKVIEEIKKDMEKETPMERLICGEVGYGKTEVALRASFKAIMDNKQVAILCPTTILVQQHIRTFRERMKNFPVVIEELSRFRSRKEIKETIAKIRKGLVDIVIGTHRLLSNDIKFKDLGLLIIDEEHRFGVMQKEKIKKLKKNVDTLSLSATPIPRTLYMGLTGIKDISLIETPPQGRKSIITEIVVWDEEFIRLAIIREIERGGQVYFVHNRIKSIDIIADKIQKMDSRIRIGIGHSKLSDSELEEIMLKFFFGEINVLVCTAIIGSGVDIPNANTIIINRADKFGIADLHQLRGRVGRSVQQAYCYLIVPKKITKEAKKRLQVIVSYTELGAGFKLALHDLELRGMGNLLGKEQHGHIHNIGYELYTKMLEDEIKSIKGESIIPKIEPKIDIGVSAYFPDWYCDKDRKLSLYKKLASCETLEEIKLFEAELVDRFGNITPPEVNNLISLAKIKLLTKTKNISKIIKSNEGFEIEIPRNRDKLNIPGKYIKNVKYAKSYVNIVLKINDIKKLQNLLQKL